jgi:hypothetical protein
MQKPDNWNELTWQQKRDVRFEWWRAAHGIAFAGEEARRKHVAAVDRIIKAVKMEELPDRVPIDIAPGSFPAYYAGYDLKTVMNDPGKNQEAWLKFARDFSGIDTIGGIGASSAPAMACMGPVTSRWPGGGLADNAPMVQFVEDEYMKFGEYGAYFANPADYILRTFLPRTYRVFEPLAKLPPLDSITGAGMQLMNAAGDPAFKQMAEDLLKAHEETVKFGKVLGETARMFREMGYPAGGSMGGLAPFDTIADMLRGTRGSVVDMFRQRRGCMR